MLKINLLPDASRKTILSPLQQLHRTPLTWFGLAGLIVIALAFVVPVRLHRRELQRLNASLHRLEPQQREVEALQRELQQLRAEAATFQGLLETRSSWAQRLNLLSNMTPEGVWFTDLTLDPGKGLMIQGSAIGQSGSEMVNVGRFVQDLKAAPEFTAVLKDIQIESIKRVQEKDLEIVQFTVACTLREGQLP